MPAKNGFSLIEMVVVLIILGMVVAISLPQLTTSFEQARAQTIENNLYAISAAEQKYFEDYGVYCTTTTDNGNAAPFCDSEADINTVLHLSLSDSFTYSCTVVAGNTPYNCTATDGVDTLLLNPNIAPPTLPVSCTCVGALCPNGTNQCPV